MAGPSGTTLPADSDDLHTAPRIIIEPSVDLPNGAVLAHHDYVEVVAPWAVEEHIRPVQESIALGDVEAWVAYVRRFGPAEQASRILLTWSERGLRAVLDYHANLETPGRAQWVATYPFVTSDQWNAWTRLANGETRWSQQQAVEKLDQLAEDIIEPDAATVLGIIRTLRASVKLSADSELREDGSSLVSFTKNSAVTGKTAIPSEIAISIPVLKGHAVEKDGKRIPVTYRLPVKVRPSIDDTSSTLSFRFFMPTAERVLEDVYADRVRAARELLGEGYTLLRAAGGG